MKDYDVNDIKGKVIKTVEFITEDDNIEFTTEDGTVYIMCHIQDCCECVEIESHSDLSKMVGAEVEDYEEESQQEDLDDCDSQTTTVCTFYTSKGSFRITWVGRSNGYYSETPTFYKKNNY